MRLLHWNVQWCRGLDGVVAPARIAREARELCDPDVICLQEVAINFPALEGSRGEDQVARLAAELPGFTAAFGWAVDVPDGAGGRRRFGNLILSRLPLRQVQRHTLPWPADSGVPSMPRALVEAVVATPYGLVRVATTHLEYYSATQRAAQVERLRELHAEACAHSVIAPSERYESGPFEPFPRPASAMLTGDFNLPPRDPLHARLLEPFGAGVPRFLDAWQHAHPDEPHPPTFCLHEREYGESPYCCDYVFVTEDLAARLRAVRVDGATRASDHQPVIVELED
jgi:endonuclease/exonuclease/phosphatase family metal-dependent hydrolase